MDVLIAVVVGMFLVCFEKALEWAIGRWRKDPPGKPAERPEKQ